MPAAKKQEVEETSVRRTVITIEIHSKETPLSGPLFAKLSTATQEEIGQWDGFYDISATEEPVYVIADA